MVSEVTASEEEDEFEDEEYEPPLTPSSRGFYYDPSPFVFAHGERGSGKTLAAEHKGVAHATEYDDALYMLVTLVRSQQGGAWEDLITKARWEDGPLEGKPKGILETWREDQGLEYGNFTTSIRRSALWTPYMDTSKNMWVDIQTRDGGVSRIIYKSMEVASQVLGRIKDFRPSFFHFEELSNTNDPAFFTAIIQQLGRRGSVPVHAQQYIATGNPSKLGQKHWAFKQFFVEPHKLRVDDKEKDELLEEHTFNPTVFHPVTNPTGHIEEWNEKYGVHHVKMAENNLMDPARKEAYISTLRESARSDPTEFDRVILGKWVPKMSGNAIFMGYFERTIHLRGKLSSGERLLPATGEQIIIGYDPGSKNNARVFLQRNEVGERVVWRQFDELIHKDQRLKIEVLVKNLMDRMLWWCKEMDYRFGFQHIADRQALEQWNHHGNFEWKEYQRISAMLIEKNPEYARWLTPIRMLAPKKGSGSVQERVKMTKDLLLSNSLYISATCTKTVEMLEQLRKAKDRQGGEDDDAPRKDRQGHIHTFDSLSYPIYYYHLMGRATAADTRKKNEVEIVSARS